MKLTKRDVDDVYRLDFGPGTAPIILSEEEMDELRAHFQAERDEQLGQCRRHHKPEPSSSVVFLHEDGVKQTPAERFASWLLERKASRQAAREYEARRCYPSSTRPNY